MTLPARARRLTVGDQEYRWLVSSRAHAQSLSVYAAAATHQRPFSTWFKVDRAALSAAWRKVRDELRRLLPQSSFPRDDPA
jgi:hypothetical protein